MSFVRSGVVLIENAGDPDDDFHDIMKTNIAALENRADARGRSIELVTIAEAYDAVACDDKFCKSYVNSYLVNGGVVMPRYGVATDDEARKAFEELFPGRRIAQVSIDNIALGGGGMHSIQQRAVVIDGEIVVRPMMYLALTYDHRIIDGPAPV